MPFREQAPFFTPDELDTLTTAFNATWQELRAAGLDLTTEPGMSLVKRKLAQRILVSATAGVRDVETLKQEALRSLSGGFCLVGEKTLEAA
jgi:hypothetical protein